MYPMNVLRFFTNQIIGIGFNFYLRTEKRLGVSGGDT
jgi:hypothetical protein